MLIVISIVFIVFSMPIDVYFLGYAYGSFLDVTPEQQAARWLFYVMVILFYYTNNAIKRQAARWLFYVMVILFYYTNNAIKRQAARWLFYVMVILFYYTNNAINFFMYFASGRKFRLAFLNTFFCFEPTKRVTTSSSGTAVTGVQNMSMTTMTQVQN